MSRIAVTLVLPLVLAVALLVPGTALADISLQGSAHGTETKAGYGAYTLSGSWSSTQLFGPAGTYYGSVTLGQYVSCADFYAQYYQEPCSAQYTDCYIVDGGTLWFSGYMSTFFHTGAFSVTLKPNEPGFAAMPGNAICQKPGGARYVNLWTLEAFAPPSISWGLGNLTWATGDLMGTSTKPVWTQPGGPSWVDDFTFHIDGGYS
jgi:hypothetical protein